jgi:predicted PurR-regulated permease PerM
MLAFDRRAAKVTWTACLVLLALFAVFSVRRTIFVFVLAVFFSYILYPAVIRVEKLLPRRTPRMVSIGVVFVLLVALIAGAAALIGPPLTEQSSRLSEQLPALIRDPKVVDRVPLPEWLAPYREKVVQYAREQLGSGSVDAVSIARKAGMLLLGVASNLIYVVLIPILAFLFIKDGARMRDRFVAWTAQGDRGSMWRRIVDDLDTLLGQYIRALLILSGATLIVYSIVFSIAGVPYGLLLAALAAVLEFIPVIGPLAAAVTVVLVAGVSGYDHVLLIVGFIVLYRVFQDYVLNPMLMSDGVAVAPLLVLFGLLAGEEIGGVVGIFLSVPVLAAAKIVTLRIGQELRAKPKEVDAPV